jgi:hypothetical protein
MNPRLQLIVLLILALPTGSGCGKTPPVATAAGNGANGTSSSGRVLETTFDDVKFEMEKTDTFQRSMLTPKVKELFGRQIRIRGYIFPTSTKRLKQFVLMRDNLECCFGPGAALFDCILVYMEPGETAEYTTRMVEVEGTFRLEEYTDYDGTVRAIYRMDGKAVE